MGPKSDDKSLFEKKVETKRKEGRGQAKTEAETGVTKLQAKESQIANIHQKLGFSLITSRKDQPC